MEIKSLASDKINIKQLIKKPVYKKIIYINYIFLANSSKV